MGPGDRGRAGRGAVRRGRGPGCEGRDLAAVGALITGQPGVQVGVAWGGQRLVVGGDPVQHGDGASEVLLDDDDLVVVGVCVAQSAAQPAQQVPQAVAAQKVLFGGVGAGGDEVGDPALQSGHLLIAVGQCGGGYEDAAQVFDGF